MILIKSTAETGRTGGEALRQSDFISFIFNNFFIQQVKITKLVYY